jgi:hypothetical protein
LASALALSLSATSPSFSFGGRGVRPGLCNLAGKLGFFGIELLNFRLRGRELSLRGLDRRFGLCKIGNKLIFFRDESANSFF